MLSTDCSLTQNKINDKLENTIDADSELLKKQSSLYAKPGPAKVVNRARLALGDYEVPIENRVGVPFNSPNVGDPLEDLHSTVHDTGLSAAPERTDKSDTREDRTQESQLEMVKTLSLCPQVICRGVIPSCRDQT